jgi:hypothetical protein
MATDEAADGGEDGEEPNQLDTFITSKKAGFAQAGVYLPVNVTAWKNQRELNTLFIAPLAKGGVMTITGDRRTAEAETFGDDDVFNFYSFGIRLGHFRYPRQLRRLRARVDKLARHHDGALGELRADDSDRAARRRREPHYYAPAALALPGRGTAQDTGDTLHGRLRRQLRPGA